MFSQLFTSAGRRVQAQSESDSEVLLSDSATAELRGHTHLCCKTQRRRNVYLVAHSSLITSCVWLTAFVGILLVMNKEKQDYAEAADEACMQHVSHYSPLVKVVKPRWHTVRFNGSFMRENVYRGPAGAEVDAAWEALGVGYRPIVVPLEEAAKSGLQPHQVQVESVYGGGFLANVEVLHHLHCLNILRKSLAWNYAYYHAQGHPPFSNSDDIIRVHVTHCLDILRQQLMCVPDVGVLGQVWWKSEEMAQPTPFVEFNTEHRCRDFEGVRAWAERHQLPKEEDVDLERFYRMPTRVGDIILSEMP